MLISLRYCSSRSAGYAINKCPVRRCPSRCRSGRHSDSIRASHYCQSRKTRAQDVPLNAGAPIVLILLDTFIAKAAILVSFAVALYLIASTHEHHARVDSRYTESPTEKPMTKGYYLVFNRARLQQASKRNTFHRILLSM